MNKKMLVVGVMMGVSFWGGISGYADNNISYTLNEVIVLGNKVNQVSVGQTAKVRADGYIATGTGMGYLGITDTLKTPFTEKTFTEKAIQDYGDPSQPVNGVIQNMPSVKTSGCTMYNDFSIRGQNLNGYQMYLNGIPGMFKQANTPANFVERIEVIAGPNKGITGTSANESAGGFVNMISKRAYENFNNVNLNISGSGLFGQYLDISRRIGDHNEWGLRINLANVVGKTAIKDERLTNRDATIDVDYRTDNSYTNLFMGYFYSKQDKGHRWFGFKGKEFEKAIEVIKAPKSSDNFSFKGFVFEYDDWAITLNHEQKIADDWKVFANMGYNRYDLFNNVNSKSSKYFIIKKDGEFEALNWVQNFPITTYYGQIGLSGIKYTGKVKHNLVLSIDKAWYDNYRNLDKNDQENQKFNTPNGNIYTGVPEGPYTNYKADKVQWGVLGSKSKRWSWSINDNIEYGKVSLLLGFFSNHSQTDTYDKKGNISKNASSQAHSPTYGIVYSPNNDMSIYASHSESFNMETVVTSKYKNVGEILPAAKTKQNEFGVKYLKDDLLTSLTYFQIKKAGNIDVTENGELYQRQNGEDEYKGVELSVNGKISPQWNIMGGIMYMDAKHNKAAKLILDGERISGASRVNGVLALEYEANDQLSIFGRMIYNGASIIWNAEQTNKLIVPSYATIDLGIKYKTSIFEVPVTINATCYNLFNKNYWIAKSGVDTVIVSNPRTFVLSAQFRM